MSNRIHYLPTVRITDNAASVAVVKVIVQDDKSIFIPKVEEKIYKLKALLLPFK